MDGQTQVVDPTKQTEEVVPDYDIVEEGSAEAKALAKQAEADAEEDADDEPDEKIGRHPEQDLNDAQRQPGANADKRKKQRQRIKDKLDAKDALTLSLRQQNQQLAERLNRLESRTGSNEIVMIDKAISDTQELVSLAEQAHAHSLTQNDPLAVTRAMRDLFAAENRLQALTSSREQAARAASAPRAIDNNVSRNVNAWMARNAWFRPETSDEDSRIAKVIDDQIAAEGFDPGTAAYWQELDRRIKRKLPHRSTGGTGRRQVQNDDIDDEDDDFEETPKEKRQEDQNRGGSKVSGSGQGSGGGGRVKITLSRERIQALKDAGKWDDPLERNKMIKAYVKYDRAAAQNS